MQRATCCMAVPPAHDGAAEGMTKKDKDTLLFSSCRHRETISTAVTPPGLHGDVSGSNGVNYVSRRGGTAD